MKITNFEAPDILELSNQLEQLSSNPYSINENDFKELATMYNAAFVVERMSRLMTMLFVELKDSYVHQSQRYVKIDSENFEKPDIDEEDLATYNKFVNQAMDLYNRMSELKVSQIKGRPKLDDYKFGIPYEDARYILPVCAVSNISASMNASKLWDLFALMNSKDYSYLFKEMKAQLLDLLPTFLAKVLNAVSGKSENSTIEFLYKKHFAKISPRDRVVKINSFSQPVVRVGLGALTSTQEKTMNEVIESYGEQLQEKSAAVANRVISYGHSGITEQTRHTFGLMMSICAYHQQARHRLYNAHRESLFNLVSTINRTPCVPPTIQNSPFADEFLSYYESILHFRTYLCSKYGPQQAYYLILNCDMIKQIVSSNARIDCDIMRDRLCQTAQWEIRELYEKKFELLAKDAPVLYKRAIPPCVSTACKEGKLTCGKATEMKEKYRDYLA